MRILITADPILPVPPKLYGGIERIVDALIIHLRRRGHKVGLVALEGSTAKADYFLPWPELDPATNRGHLKNALALRRAVREFDPEVVHSFSRLLYLLPILMDRRPKVMSYQRFTGGRQISIAAVLSRGSLTYTGNSEFIADMGRPSGGTWHAIPNFVDTDQYAFSPTVPQDAPLVFLSRVEEIKGAHLAVEAALRTGRRLIIAGNHADSGADGAYWSEVIKPKLGRSGIEYVGPVDDAAKIQLLGRAAAMIVPIQWDEPFGIVFAEALACGTPVISCPRGALPEIVRPGVDGFLVNSIEEACAAVEKVGGLSRHACRERAETLFSAEVVVGQYESLYRSLMPAR